MPLPKIPGYSIATDHMAEKIKVVQLEVKGNFEESNSKYKEATDKHIRLEVFKEGDLVIVYLQ